MVSTASRPPGGTLQLAPQMASREALLALCRRQLQAIEQHRPGARQGRDPEQLHDLRVAVRRTRSILSEFRNFFLPAQLERFRREFRWFGEITGAVRDLDVYLRKLPDYCQLLSAEDAAALEPFRRFLRRRRREERRHLARRLASQRLQRLLEDWRRFLEGGDRSVWPEAAGQPAGETARRHIWKLYRRFVGQGAAIGAKSPDSDLHELRITGKKLRYLMEFFRSFYPAAEIAVLIKAMKEIQDFLGDYQDLTVQQGHLMAMARRMAKEESVPVESLAALAALVESLRHRQQRARREFPERFRSFSRGCGRRGFVRLFAPRQTER